MLCNGLSGNIHKRTAILEIDDHIQVNEGQPIFLHEFFENPQFSEK